MSSQFIRGKRLTALFLGSRSGFPVDKNLPVGRIVTFLTYVPCAGCGRRLGLKEYGGSFPGANVPPERVTWGMVSQGAPTFAVFCTCGHYTVDSWVPRRLGDAERTEDPGS